MISYLVGLQPFRSLNASSVLFPRIMGAFHCWMHTLLGYKFPPRALGRWSLLYCMELKSDSLQGTWSLCTISWKLNGDIWIMYCHCKPNANSSQLNVAAESLGGIPYNGLYGEAAPERGIFFRLQVYERVGNLLGEVHKRVEESAIWVSEKAQKANRWILWLYKSRKRSIFVINSCLNDSGFIVVKRDAKF